MDHAAIERGREITDRRVKEAMLFSMQRQGKLASTRQPSGCHNKEGEKPFMEYFDCVIERESDVLFNTAGEIKTLCGLLIDSINFQMCERGLDGEIGNPIHSVVCMITQRADEIQESMDQIGSVITDFLSELKKAA